VVTSGKGGVGKTTSTAALAQAGQKVAVVDFDVGPATGRALRRAPISMPPAGSGAKTYR
jgi:Mrp family chromosome partitioning ATPase